MTDIKKGTEAKQFVEDFPKKGKVEAFVCGTAKMLEEKVKNSDPVLAQLAIGGAIIIGGMIASAAVCSGVPNTINTAEAVSLSAVLAGAAMVADHTISAICDRPVLLERLANLSKEGIKNAPKNISNDVTKSVTKTKKNVNNFISKTMEKGGR